LFLVLFNIALLRSFQLICILKQVFYRFKLLKQLNSGFLSNTGTTRYVIRAIAHQAKQINHLGRVFNIILFYDFFIIKYFVIITTILWPVYKNSWFCKLTIVFV